MTANPTGGPRLQLQQDAFSQVLDVLRVRGTTVVYQSVDPLQSLQVAATSACVYVPQAGTLMLCLHARKDAVVVAAGEVALLVRGTAHTLSSPGGSQYLRGDFVFDGVLVERFLGMIPDVIVLSRQPGDAHTWIDLACAFILEEATLGKAGAAAMVSRLLDLLFIRSLRTWASEGEGGHGWLAGAVDARLGRVLAAMHQDPCRPWTVQQLADLGSMSRTSFANRFLSVVGQTPVAYLTGWRLDRAAELLRHRGMHVRVVAEQIGYASDSAFIRAFKQRFHLSPRQWRSAMSDSLPGLPEQSRKTAPCLR